MLLGKLKLLVRSFKRDKVVNKIFGFGGTITVREKDA